MTTLTTRFIRLGLVATAMSVVVAGLAIAASVSEAGRAGAEAEIKGPAWVTSRLNLREGPGLDHDVITVMQPNSRILIRGAARHGWYPVTYIPEAGRRIRGFAHGDSIARWAVATDNVNLRSGPGTNHDIRTVVPKNTRVVVVGLPRNGFYPVTYPLPQGGFLQGWSSKDYLRWGVGAPPDWE
jgi:uncharacterized protein YgiM (DUF1202 family)